MNIPKSCIKKELHSQLLRNPEISTEMYFSLLVKTFRVGNINGTIVLSFTLVTLPGAILQH